MQDLAARIKKLVPAANISPGGNVEIRDDGDGPYIYRWDAAIGEQPTEEQLLAVDVRRLKPRDQLEADWNALAVGLSTENRNLLWAMLYRFSLKRAASVQQFDALTNEEKAAQLAIIGLNDDYADKILDAADRDPAGFAAIVQQFNPSYDPYEGA